MNYDDALVILGLTPDDCSLANLKKAYAKGAKAHRPETDPEGFTHIRLAYERVKEALIEASEHNNATINSVTLQNNDTKINDSLFSLKKTIAKYEYLDLTNLSSDLIVKQHQEDVLALETAWQLFVTQFLATEHLTATESNIAQLSCLNTVFKEPALAHYLSRQVFAEKLGWLILEEANTWVSLDSLKLTLKTFDYELYGWHNQSWTQHSLLEAKCDGLREKMFFQLNAKQKDTLEYYLVSPMGLLSFTKLWFIYRRQAKNLKLRLMGINKKYPQWANLLNPRQVWRIENWPNSLTQLICLLLGLVSIPFLFILLNTIHYHYFSEYSNTDITRVKTKEINTVFSIVKDISIVIGSTILCSFIYMSIYAHCRYHINLHYKNFTKNINIDAAINSSQTDGLINTLPKLNLAQRLYKYINNQLTLSFFGNIEAVSVLILLFFWPWQRPQVFSRELMETYTLASAVVGTLTFMYLRYLSKLQRIRPNHPYICAAAVFLGIYMLSASNHNNESIAAMSLAKESNPSRWTILILTALMVRTQFPSFLRIDWSQTIPSWLLFNRFRVLEKLAVKALSILSILLFLVVLFLKNIFVYPIIASLICVIIYLWLIINADMDAPVMSLQARIITAVAVIGGISIKLSPIMSNVAALEWILSSSMLVSMIWYWAYGYSQNYFERWKLKAIPI
ncbi:MAG: hypothetical protein RL344_206 [Pseudomonadota bacterium]|jgi:hypothetical protein